MSGRYKRILSHVGSVDNGGIKPNFSWIDSMNDDVWTAVLSSSSLVMAVLSCDPVLILFPSLLTSSKEEDDDTCDDDDDDAQ